MSFVFDERSLNTSFVETIWRTQTGQGGSGSFMSLAESHWGIVVTQQYGKTIFTVRGPESKAMPAPVPENAEFFGIIFRLGTFMPHLPNIKLVDDELHLPAAASKSVWLHGSSWQLPNFENADTFVERLVREGMVVRDPVVQDTLQGHLPDVTVRSVQRRFLRATGLTHGAIRQIERAHKAAALLRQGVSILDTVYEVGYADQPHLTRALKYRLGQTPAQLIRENQAE